MGVFGNLLNKSSNRAILYEEGDSVIQKEPDWGGDKKSQLVKKSLM